MNTFYYKIILLFTLFFPVISYANTAFFIKNQGQLRNDDGEIAQNVLAYYKGKTFDFYFQNDRISYVFKSIEEKKQDIRPRINEERHYLTKSYRVDMIFQSINEKAEYKMDRPTEINYSYMNENVGDLRIKYGYQEIVYYNLYEGIDVRFYFQENALKYDFIVHPGADVNRIELKYEGAKNMISKEQSIIVETPLGNLVEYIPEVYQKNNNIKKRIKGYYNLNKNVVSFHMDSFDLKKEIIIDPWATFVGGADIEECYSTCVDKQGNAYITGYTGSSNFPVTVGALQTNLQGQYDAFVVKLDTTGNAIWSMFYGGLGNEFGYEVLVDANDNPYVVGYTDGNDILVSSSGVFQSNSNGSYDSFVLKLDSAGNFIWGTYFGGSGGEFTLAADIGANNSVVIGGFTSSNNMPRLNAFQNTFGGALDAFVAKFDSTGNLLWSTFCGGSNSEDVHAVKIDDQNNVIITGETYSTDFPASVGAFQPNNNGNLDAFLTKYDDQGNRIFSTCFGGLNADDGYGVGNDAQGNIYLVGYSESTDFPIIGASVYQSIKNFGKDGFVAKFTPLGQPIRSTFIGGSGDDRFNSVRISTTNSLYVAGYTSSMDIPIIGVPYQLNNGGMTDGVYYKLDTALSPNYSTYVGGISSDYIYDLYVDSDQVLTFAGYTFSANFPATINVFQDTLTGQSDAFVFQTDSTFSFTTSVNACFSGHQAVIYPNPFNDQININIMDFEETTSYRIEIYDALGKQIQNKTIYENDSNLFMDIKIKEGLYFLSLYKDNVLIDSFKIIKKGKD